MLILDTFNILHAAPRVHEQLRGLTLPMLIRLLEVSRWARGPVLLVCDGAGGRATIPEHHLHPDAPIRIVFAGPGKDADSLIERLIIQAEQRRGGSGRGLTIVSSDKGVLASAVGPIGPKPTRLTSERFLHHLLADVSRAGGQCSPERVCSESTSPQSVSHWLAQFGIVESQPTPSNPPKAPADGDILEGFDPADLDMGRWLDGPGQHREKPGD